MDDVVHGVRTPIELVGCRFGLRDFLQVWEANFDAVTNVVLDAAASMPGLCRVFRRSDGGRTRSAFRRALVAVRHAILEWDWAGLLTIRRIQGRIFADRGIPLEEISQIFLSFRESLVPYLMEAFGDDAPRLLSSLEAADRYVRLSLSVVLEAYMTAAPFRLAEALPPAPREIDDQVSCPAI